MDLIPIWNGYVHGAHLPKVRATWLWVHCEDPHCGHARAVPVAPWLIRWGIENKDICRALRVTFYCGVCGRRGCYFGAPLITGEGMEAFPPPGEQVRINGPRRWHETYPAAEERNRTEYLAKYPSGDALGEFRRDDSLRRMCNLYSVRPSRDELKALARALGEWRDDDLGNFEPLPAVFPNGLAPVVRNVPGGREALRMRWGFPPPNIPGRKPRNPYLTNVRNTDSKYWRRFLNDTANRCLVPVSSFAEPDNRAGDDKPSIWTWFAQNDNRPLMFFAGIWRECEGDRGTKKAPQIGKHLVFSFLTTDASPDVAPIHPDATPVLLLDEAAREQWMNAPLEEALLLQKPPPAGSLKVVASGKKED